MATLYLKGFIRDATYTPHLNPEKLEVYDITRFDVNQAQTYGLIDLGTSGNNYRKGSAAKGRELFIKNY